MPSQPTTRRVQRAEELIQSTEPRERIARCGIRVSMVGNRKKQESPTAKAFASKFGQPQPEPKEKEPDFLSPEAQNAVAAAYAAQHGMSYDAEASLRLKDLDSRASREGSWEKRKGLQQHLKDAQDGKFTDIIFYKLSRLSRNTRDGLLVVKAFHDAGITIHFARDSLNRQIDGKYGELMLMVGFWVNENEIETLGDHISDAIEQKWKEGKPHGQPPGWTVSDEAYRDHRRLVELALEGHTYHVIARMLNEERIRTPRGKRWTSTDISVRLNPRYIKKMQGFAISTPLTDGTEKMVPDAWGPAGTRGHLITQDEADTLNMLHNKMLSRRTSALVRPGGKGHSNYASHMLSGTARCAICGKLFSASKGVSGYKDTPYFSYMCDKGIWGDPHHEAAGNKKLTIKCDSLDEAVLRVLRLELTLPPPPVSTPVRSPRVKPKVTAADVEKKIERAKSRRLEMDIDEYIDLINHLTSARDRLLEEEAQPQRTDFVELALKAAGEDEKLQNRALVKAMVADVLFPYYIPGRRKVPNGRSEYRAARVVFHNKREYMVPIYRDGYRGNRAVIPVSANETFANMPTPSPERI